MISIDQGLFAAASIQIARDQFPGAGSILAMLSICRWFARRVKFSKWTWQTREHVYSNPCTGGALLPAASAGFAMGKGVPRPVSCSWAAALACLVRWTRERDAERLTPQECAIAGPAVYPIKAPATAPTGPSTTAPETAPKAALPARSCAVAATEKNDAAIAATTSSFFIAISLCIRPNGTTLWKCGGTKVSTSTVAAASKEARYQDAGGQQAKEAKSGIRQDLKKPAAVFSGSGLFKFFRRWTYGGDLPDGARLLLIRPKTESSRQIFRPLRAPIWIRFHSGQTGKQPAADFSGGGLF
jgi:hypothetical protein